MEVNRVIVFTGGGAKQPFSCLMADQIPESGLIANCGLIPLWWYKDGVKRPALPAASLAKIQAKYPSHAITHEDVFYYIYGVLHLASYRERYQTNLSKDLPRIPFTPNPTKFFELAKAGRRLGDLHVNYDNQDLYQDCELNFNPTNPLVDKGFVDYFKKSIKKSKKINKKS